jgi:heat shock protein HtpX
MSRILLFGLTNIAVLLVAGIAMQVFGIDRLLAQQGIGSSGMLFMFGLIGMGGSFVSLLLSKSMAKWSTGAQVISEPRNATESWLVQTVAQQAKAAGIGMPEVAIFSSPSPNAFATGANKDSALVAVSTGLLQRMSREEVEAVLGHEVSHVANGDMVTLTLIQGVLNTFVMFLSRVAGLLLDSFLRRNDDEQRGFGMGYMLSSMVFQILFGILASVVVMWFSRHREYRADAGGARLAGRTNMIRALEALKSASEGPTLPKELTAFGIAGGGGFARLFMSHPPLDERIAALQRGEA